MTQYRRAKAFQPANPGPGKRPRPYVYRGAEPHVPKPRPETPQDEPEETA